MVGCLKDRLADSLEKGRQLQRHAHDQIPFRSTLPSLQSPQWPQGYKTDDKVKK